MTCKVLGSEFLLENLGRAIQLTWLDAHLRYLYRNPLGG